MPSKRHRNQDEDEEQQLAVMPRRRQPLRRCKKFRYHGNTRLLDLPDDIIREILEFGKPKDEQEGWIWLCKMRRVCNIFHELVKALPPTVLDVTKVFALLPSGSCHAPFLRSILDNPWMRAKLTHFLVTDSSCACAQCHRNVTDNQEVLHSIRSLLETQEALDNLELLDVRLLRDNKVFTVEPNDALLRSFANLSTLKKLHLAGVGSTGVATPEMFERLMATLCNPLECFSLINAPWIKDCHVEQCLQRYGGRLTELQLCPNHQFGTLLVSERMLRAVANYCPRLETLCLDGASFTSDDLEAFLRMRGPSLQQLDLTECSFLDTRAIDAIVNYAPNLRKVSLKDNDWLTNDLFDRLVRGRVSYRRDQPTRIGLPLKEIDVRNTSVSGQALLRLIDHIVSARSSGITVYGSGWIFHGLCHPEDNTVTVCIPRAL
jgi:hypothetical protein